MTKSNKKNQNKNELIDKKIKKQTKSTDNKKNEQIKEQKTNDNKKESLNSIEDKDLPKYHFYLGYNGRVLMYSLCILVFLVLSLFFIIRSFSIIDEQNINYQETSDLDYKVYLKENSFYENDYLEKDMVYVASLIDKIDIDFDYVFKIDRNSNINFNYDIVGRLVIADNNGENIFLEKEYTLLNNIKETMINENIHEIKRSISIDYDYYNNLANSFRANYGVDTSSNLIVYLRINEHNNEINNFELDNNSEMLLSIPLSERVVNIKLDYKDIDESNNIIKKSQLVVNNYLYIVIGIISIILIILFMIRLIKLISLIIMRKSKYDKYVRRILNEYDRLIVETTTGPNITDKRVIKIHDFQELLDVRDNLKLPIKYFVVNAHQKCNFYIDHNDEIYLLILKEVDIKD